MLRALTMLLVLVSAPCVALPDTAVEPRVVQVLVDERSEPPAANDPRWTDTNTPDSQDHAVAWYRVPFVYPGGDLAAGSWMVYLPYFYGGGRLWLNGEPVAALQENSDRLRVRWERPLLLPLPQHVLHPGPNELLIRAVASHPPSGLRLPRLVLGPQDELQPQFDLRLFVVRTLPLVTVLTGAVAGLFVLFIWLRRPQEVLYGLFGLAALLWALRTTTFVFDATPLALWPWWRMLYHGSTGGFIITLALFAQAQVGWWRPRVAWALGAYGLLGPLLYLTSGDDADELVGRWWVLGLAPIGVSVAALSLLAAWRQRSRGTAAIALALALAAGAGMHDYAVAWSTPWLTALAPDWVSHRLFLLHHAANALLMVMGALLTTRFIGSLRAVEDARLTLQLRVAERERELAAGYARIAELQREQAAQEATEQERQRIMQELHDGLGSQLFTSLLRAERGALQGPEVAETLRGAIDEMRVAIEALASEDQDLRTAFGNFRFRWEARLREAGLACDWQVQLPDAVMQLPPHDTLQLLRVAQEALTNVLKHAGAHQVQVALRQEGQALLLQVHDDGCGASSTSGAPPEGGRGLANMRARAARAGATLELQLATLQQPGTRVQLRLPLRQPLRAATAFT